MVSNVEGGGDPHPGGCIPSIMDGKGRISSILLPGQGEKAGAKMRRIFSGPAGLSVHLKRIAY